MAKHLLTDRQLRNAKPGDSPLYDGDGLRFVPSRTTNVISVQWKFTRPDDGKEDVLTLGKYPRVSLARARDDADEARRLVARGENPKLVKRIRKAEKKADVANTFGSIAKAWVTAESRRNEWSAAYVDEVEQSLRNHLADLDPLPVATIVARITASLLHAVEVSAPAMEEKVSRRLYAILDFAVELGTLTRNPLPQRRRPKRERKHYPAVTSLPGIGEILRAARAADPCRGIQRAHLLRIHGAACVRGRRREMVRVRPGAGTWSVPRARMKRKDIERGPHDVPIPLFDSHESLFAFAGFSVETQRQIREDVERTARECNDNEVVGVFLVPRSRELHCCRTTKSSHSPTVSRRR